MLDTRTVNAHSSSHGLRLAWTATAAALVLSLGASACVSQSTYEEAKSAADVEHEAHRRARAELAQVQAQLTELQDSLKQRESEVQEQERRLAEADLHLKLAHQERDENGVLVDQLRGELARVGDHLRVFSEQKTQLAAELREAELRSRLVQQRELRVRQLTELVRDATLLEASAIHSGVIVLSTDHGSPVLRIPRQTLAPDGKLGADGTRITKNLGRLAKLHDKLRYTISARGEVGKEPPNALLLREVSDGLVAAGVARDKVTLDPTEASKSAEEASTARELPASAPGGEVVIVLQLGEPVSASQPDESAAAADEEFAREEAGVGPSDAVGPAAGSL